MAKVKLGKREKTTVLIGLLLVVLVAGLQLGRKPWREYQRAEAALKTARAGLEKAEQWRSEIEAMRSERESVGRFLQGRGPRFDLYAFISGILAQQGLLERGATLKETKSTSNPLLNMSELEVSLTGVTMEELVNVLHAVYAPNNLVLVQKVGKIAPAKDLKGLDCTLTVVTPRS